MPKRIQRRRVKGWRMPEGAVSVTRPLFWGNPFRVGHHYKRGGIPRMGLTFTYMEAYEGHQDATYTTIQTLDESLEWYMWYVGTWSELMLSRLRKELAGKDLACWCKEGATCHADILLELANASPTT